MDAPARILFCAIATAHLVACGGSTPSARAPESEFADLDASPELGSGGVNHAPMESISTPITQLARADVVATVDAGLGRFLQKFEMEASLTASGEFTGFRIVRVHDTVAFNGLGIGPGDIVTSINQRPIERPTEAYEAFVSLRTAPSLDIDYLRGGRLMHLSLPIVGSAPPAPTAASAESKTSAATRTNNKGTPQAPERQPR